MFWFFFLYILLSLPPSPSAYSTTRQIYVQNFLRIFSFSTNLSKKHRIELKIVWPSVNARQAIVVFHHLVSVRHRQHRRQRVQLELVVVLVWFMRRRNANEREEVKIDNRKSRQIANLLTKLLLPSPNFRCRCLVNTFSLLLRRKSSIFFVVFEETDLSRVAGLLGRKHERRRRHDAN